VVTIIKVTSCLELNLSLSLVGVIWWFSHWHVLNYCCVYWYLKLIDFCQCSKFIYWLLEWFFAQFIYLMLIQNNEWTHISLKSACCACLTELVVNDTNGLQTVQNNGIYLLASLIVPPSGEQPTNKSSLALQVIVFIVISLFKIIWNSHTSDKFISECNVI